MSDQSTPSPAPPSAPSSASSVRPFILLAILVVALGALAYDRLVARPGAEQGYQIVMTLAELRSSSARGQDYIGPEQVQKKLGKKPASEEIRDRYFIETYNWRGGALVKSHFVKVIYSGDKKLLYTALLNEEPNEDNLPTNKQVSADEADPRPANGPTNMGPPGGMVRPPSGVTPPAGVKRPALDDAQPNADQPPAKPADPPATDKPKDPPADSDKTDSDKTAEDKPKADPPEAKSDSEAPKP